MKDIAIKVRNLAKSYTIGDTTTGSLRETISNFFSRSRKKKTEEFWALQDVSFDIERGEAVGIIGKNGAGKSTLLKVLSRITEPTAGRIEIDGRVSSLLEVGTGFHPELTGRENIFLNGTILGMTRAEVKSKFDEIVDFSGVEKFLDTPVKRYSSGMKVRLAFSVAAHLEPEILIIDEVLAVGDAEFQKKCLGKMQDVTGHGRTILFVSHNMAAVENLCSKAILLQNGQKIFEGDTRSAIELYMRGNSSIVKGNIGERKDREGNGRARVTDIWIENEGGSVTNTIGMGDGFIIKLIVEGKIENAVIGILIGDNTHQQLVRGHTYESYNETVNINGKLEVMCYFKSNPLLHGLYNIHIWIGELKELADYIENAIELEIVPKDVFKTGKMLDKRTVFFSYHEWDIKQLNKEVSTFNK